MEISLSYIPNISGVNVRAVFSLWSGSIDKGISIGKEKIVLSITNSSIIKVADPLFCNVIAVVWTSVIGTLP